MSFAPSALLALAVITLGLVGYASVGPRLGLQAEVRYHAPLHQASGLPYSPPTGGRSVLSVGIVFDVKR